MEMRATEEGVRRAFELMREEAKTDPDMDGKRTGLHLEEGEEAWNPKSKRKPIKGPCDVVYVQENEHAEIRVEVTPP